MISLVVECQCGAWDVGAVIRNGLKMHLERIHTDNRMYLLVDGAEPSFCSRSLEIAMMDLSIDQEEFLDDHSASSGTEPKHRSDQSSQTFRRS